MKRHVTVAVGAAIALFAIFYFSPSGTIEVLEPKAAQAQDKSGSMPGMPGMKAEKPTSKAPLTSKAARVEETKAEAPSVEIPTDKRQLMGVKTATALVQPLTKTIRTVGLVEYDQRLVNTINTKIEGWIEKLYVNFTGSQVKKGDPVADIYSPELWATQQEFINMAKWAKRTQARSESRTKTTEPSEGDFDVASMIDRDAQFLVEAARQRLKLWDISDAQIARIEESEKPIRTLTVYSPYSGYVLQKSVNQGQRIMPGEKLLDVVDLSTVWINADIYEFELPLIKVGDKATIELSYLPGKRFSTKIDYINPVLEGETRTAKARFLIPNEDGRIKPQMFTNVEITIDLGRTLVVPAEAVINTGVRKIAYVDKGDGNFEPREVITGTETEKMVEITAGLKAGEKVASAANFLIDSEAKLKGVEPLPRKTATANANRESRNAKQGADQARSPAPTESAPQHRH
jgi:membrane fusion protein, copper/silver efflux system